MSIPSDTIRKMRFSGKLQERGFWLYIWEIENANRIFYYVGRTGDTSSINASSPFDRMVAHFNVRPNAKGNSIIKHLRKMGISHTDCSYTLLAYGPIHAEQATKEAHNIYRDEVAALEAELAHKMKTNGYEVLGEHPKRRPVDVKQFNKLWERFRNKLRIQRSQPLKCELINII